MASYLDPDEQNQALSQGLLGLGAGLLSGSFGHYGALAPSLGMGATGFAQGYGNAQKFALEQQQLKMLKQNYDRQNTLMDLAARYLPGAQPQALGPAPAIPGTSTSPYVNAPPPPPAVPGTSTSPYVNAPALLSSAGPMPALSQPATPSAPSNERENLARLGLVFGIGKMDPGAILNANEQLYPKGVAQRENAPVVDPFSGKWIAPPYPKLPDGLAARLNADGQYEIYQLPNSNLIASQAAGVKGATTQAEKTVEDQHTMIEVPNGKGGTVLMSRADYLSRQKPASQPATTAASATSYGGSLGTSQGTESKEYSTKLAGAREGYTNTALAAQEALPSIQLMKNSLINGLKTNNLAEYTSGFGGWMKAFGFDPTQYGINDPTNVQEFSKGATKLVADMTRALGGREPFQAMQFVQKGNPGLGNTVDANVKLVALAEGTKLWEIERDRQAQTWAQAHGGTTDGFIQNFQMKHPVQTFWQKSYDDLKKQVPEVNLEVKPYRPNGNSLNMGPQEQNFATQPLRKRSDGSYDYVPRSK